MVVINPISTGGKLAPTMPPGRLSNLQLSILILLTSNMALYLHQDQLTLDEQCSQALIIAAKVQVQASK